MSLPKLDLSSTADKGLLRAHVGSTKGPYTYSLPLSPRTTRRELLDCNLGILLACFIKYITTSISNRIAEPWGKPARRPKMSSICVSRSLEQVNDLPAVVQKPVLTAVGMGGLATSLALAKQGFRQIDVYESASNLGFVGAGIQLAPNMARILDRLGVWKEIEAEAVDLKETSIRRSCGPETCHWGTSADLKNRGFDQRTACSR